MTEKEKDKQTDKLQFKIQNIDNQRLNNSVRSMIITLDAYYINNLVIFQVR